MAQSGLSIERFAKERGLVPQRVRWWKNKLEGKSAALVRSQSPLALLPVQLTESAPSKRGEPVAVYLRSGHIVKVGRGFELGRKNYLFVGDVDAGMSIAGLYTLVATCEARGINPFAYLADVIPRVQDHPKRRLDELLPGPWARARA